MSKAASKKPAVWRRSTFSTVRFLQYAHRRRARRWATTQSIAEAVRNGGIPISVRRGVSDGAAFVWGVEGRGGAGGGGPAPVFPPFRARGLPRTIEAGV